MKTDDIIQSIKDDTFADKEIIPSEINTYEIINISDMDVLQEIGKNREKFRFLKQTETWPKDDSRQFILGSMDKLNSFINGIANGECRCLKYRYFGPPPELEESLGLMIILSRKQHDRPLEAAYKCQCTICQTIFVCNQSEVRFGKGYSWSRTSS